MSRLFIEKHHGGILRVPASCIAKAHFST
jgi:hypothetical protein